MPMHDWRRVDAGTYHAFHMAWITELMKALNNGLLPPNYYAMAEQQARVLGPDELKAVGDILTLERTTPSVPAAGVRGGLALAEAPPRVGRRVAAAESAVYRALRRTLAVRHVTGHRVVALIEIVSPGNKDRRKSVEEFTEKVFAAVKAGFHVLLVDPFPPGRHDPNGLHRAIWELWDDDPNDVPSDRPLTTAAYRADRFPEAFLTHFAVGEPLPEMPLFLETGSYINLPLGPSYQEAFRGMPAFWRDMLEGREPAP